MANQNKQKVQAQLIAVIIGIGLMVVKFIAFAFTNSNAILTDALESIVNVSAGSFALYSLIVSAKPKDRDHPYGHGKIEFISAGLEGGMISIAGLIIIGKSIYNFIYPQDIEQLDTGAILTAISTGVNMALGAWLVRRGKATRSLALEADGKHLLSDAYSSIGLLIGLVIIYLTQVYWLDNVVAILFGLILIYSGWKIVARSGSGIMDETDFELVGEIIQVLDENRRESWIDIHNLRIIKYGSSIHVDAHATLPYYYDLKTAHIELEIMDKLITDHYGTGTEFFIHADYCVPKDQCSICIKSDCEVRQSAFSKKIPWTLESVLPNKRHNYKDYLDDSPLK